jgi:DNA (cytosine-5)-methyltransferase 1
MQNIKYIDLCAGSGAFSYVLNEFNAKCVMANDFCKNAKNIYNVNFQNHNFIFDDLLNIPNENIPDHNLITAGFSCQPYSISGRQLGFQDERSNVLLKILDIISYKKPQFIIFENVKNFISHNNGLTLQFLLDKFKDMNYYVKYKVLDTSIYSEIPHHRERVYFVAFSNKQHFDKFDFNFERKEKKNIKDFLQNNISNKYYYTNTSKIYNTLVNSNMNHINDNIVYQYRRTFVRENKNNCVPTLTHNMGTGGHNVPIIKDNIGIRKLTPRECFNLQGFPDTYILPSNISDSGLYGIAGNGVTINIVRLIINKLNYIL